MENKKICLVAGAVFAAIIVGIIMLKANSGGSIPKRLELGNRYLEELNYEQALVTFEGVLEIDPVNVEAYLGIVETYLVMGDYGEAKKYAEKGYDLIRDEGLEEKLKISNVLINGYKKSLHYDSENILLSYDEYNYSRNGELIESRSYINGTIVNSWKYIYNANGQQIKSENYDKEGRLIGYTEQFIYDDNGQLLEFKSYTSDGMLFECYENSYHKNGMVVEQKCYDVYGSNNTLKFHNETFYNEDGRLMGKRFYDTEGELESYFEYVYNENGQVIKLIFSSFDESGNLLGSYIEFVPLSYLEDFCIK